MPFAQLASPGAVKRFMKGARILPTYAIAYLRDFALSHHVLAESFETFVPWSKLGTMIERVCQRVPQASAIQSVPAPSSLAAACLPAAAPPAGDFSAPSASLLASCGFPFKPLPSAPLAGALGCLMAAGGAGTDLHAHLHHQRRAQ